MSNIQKQHKISPAIAWLTIQKFIIFYCPLDGEHTSQRITVTFLSNKIIWTNQLSVVPFYILILTNTYSNVKSDTLKIMLSNLIILSDLLHHLVHHFHIKLHHFMIQYTTLPFFKILQNTSKYKGLRSYINLWKSIIRKSINSFL